MKWLALLVWSSVAAHAQSPNFNEQFREPPMSARPQVRWWWPGADVDDSELQRELRELKGNGWGGAEVSFLPPQTGFDFKTNGWGSPRHLHALEVALTEAHRLGLRLDLTLAPSWPLSAPALTSLDDSRVSQDLITQHEEVPPGQCLSEVLTPPSSRAQLVAVVRATATSREIDPASLVVLTRSPEVSYCTPRDEASTLIFSFWMQPTGQTTTHQVSSSPVYVLDHFSKAATRALTDEWDQTLLTPPVRELIRASHSRFFADSLELSATQLWTPTLLAEFRKRRGYDLTPYLPILHIQHLYDHPGANLGLSVSPDSPSDYDLPNAAGARVRSDYYKTLSELMEDNHLKPLRDWAHAHGTELRYQVGYGSTLNAIANERFVDVPETENLYAGNQIDFYRAAAGGAHATSKPILSIECCAAMTEDYGQAPLEMMSLVNRAYAGGVNNVVLHGLPFRYLGPGVTWPGWQPFAPSTPIDFSEAWDNRQPFARELPAFTRAVARSQWLLQLGSPQIDLAIYRESFWSPSVRWFFETTTARYFADTSLERAGFSYDFVSPENLGTTYKALILDHPTELSAAGARAILTWLQSGRPVLLIGDLPAKNSALVAQIRNSPRLTTIANAGDALATLENLGVRAQMHSERPGPLLLTERRTAQGAVYYFFNSGTESATESFAPKTPSRFLYRLDIWTGDISLASSPFTVSLAAGEGAFYLASDSRLPAIREVVDDAKSALELRSWQLHLEPSAPGPTEPIERTLTQSQPWSSLEGSGTVSGVGTYKTSLHIDAPVPANATLHWGKVSGTFAVRVNGRKVDVNPYANELRIGPWLRSGENHIEMEIASTLRNELSTLWQKGWATQLAGLYKAIQAPLPEPAPYTLQEYGLTGPVTITDVNPN